ncbi:hypothetical protein [Pedobacter sp. MC2016-24]|uniref:hypothetical protein n=1 Tax=Pedobacter sp. MC2016-24 TaxID=2780090 RepID=UPI00188246F4|nr:hypothetical protein [Pedobacter sp. MC2016-24]MBE9602779.1 hypothetical protein [Pedobacter sp. MC2016-24]
MKKIKNASFIKNYGEAKEEDPFQLITIMDVNMTTDRVKIQPPDRPNSELMIINFQLQRFVTNFLMAIIITPLIIRYAE